MQNHWTNFNQTWHKASFSEGNLSFFSNKGQHPQYWKYNLPTFKSLLNQNHMVTFNQSSHKAFNGDGDSNEIKGKTIAK